MSRILVTAFEPYGPWPENSSWLTLVELTKDLPSQMSVTTRRYPVDYDVVRERLQRDLQGHHDFALHLGQSPGATQIQLETVALNLAGELSSVACPPLDPAGPLAYQTPLPMHDLCEHLHVAGFPSAVSHHAGTYLCNGLYYLSQHICACEKLATRSLLLHLPLELRQTVRTDTAKAAWPAQTLAEAVRTVLEWLNTLLNTT